MNTRIAVFSWIELWEMDIRNNDEPSVDQDRTLSPLEKIPLLFEKGMTPQGIADVLSGKEKIIIDGEEFPVILDSEGVALNLLYHYVVKQNVEKIKIFISHEYVSIVNIMGYETILQCMIRTVTPTNNDHEFVVRVDNNLYISLLSTLESLSDVV